MPPIGIDTPYFIRHRWRPWQDKQGHHHVEHEVQFMREPGDTGIPDELLAPSPETVKAVDAEMAIIEFEEAVIDCSRITRATSYREEYRRQARYEEAHGALLSLLNGRSS